MRQPPGTIEDVTITFCGDNTFAIRQQLDELVAKFVAVHGANAVERLDGTTLTSAQLREQVSAVSLFAPERCIVLKNASANKDLFAELGDIAAATPDGVTLVIVEGVLDKRTKTYKTLKAKTDFRECLALNDAALQKWVLAAVKAQGGNMNEALARTLVERVGNDQWQLASEIAKLVAWDKNISAESIETLVMPNAEVSAFALLDAALAGRTAESKKMLQQMKLRSDPYEFFGLLVWQVQALALVGFAPSLNNAELAQKTGLKPFVLQKSQQLARRLGQEKIRSLVEDVAQLDVQLKSTGVEPWILVEQGLGKIGR